MEKITKNIVTLQKKFIVINENNCNNKNIVATFQANLMKWGYMLTEKAFNSLIKADVKSINNLHNEVIEYIKDITGGKLDYTPMYKNFPEEIMNKSDFELFINAIIHYWTNGVWIPESIEMEHPIVFENIKYNMINLGDENKFHSIFTDLLSINTSLTPQDMKIVNWFITSKQKLIFPDIIPFKENMCTLASLGIDIPIKTTTDVLRIAVHFSGGDISLPKVPNKKIKKNYWSNTIIDNPKRDEFKFKKFTREERRYLLSMLNNSNCDICEMVLKSNRWVRLGEILHPGDYKNQFPRAYEAFSAIRNTKVKSWYSKLNKAFEKSLEDGLKVLIERPGEFSRRMDWLIRTNIDKLDIILYYFENAVKGTSNKVLFEMYSHFEGRREESKTQRMVKPKGARVGIVLPTLEPLGNELVDYIQLKIFEVLARKFSELEKLPICWIDPELKKIPLPTNMRSMNISQKPTIRGQRIPFDNSNAKVIRSFVYWEDAYGNEDLDISATFIGEIKSQVLSYSTSGLKVNQSCHSGDIRNRKGNCAEYIDIVIDDAIKNGYHYVMIDVRNYNGRGLGTVNPLFGMMEREYPKSNKIWLPETISNTFKLQSKSKNTLIVILDLETKEYIMIDEDINGTPYATGQTNDIIKLVEYYSQEPKISVYDLIKIHAEVRAEDIVETPETAEMCFKFDDFCFSYEKIAKYMGV